MPGVTLNIAQDLRNVVHEVMEGHETEIPDMLAAALNDSAKSLKTNMIRLIRERVNIKRKDIDNPRHMRIDRASASNLEARVVLNKTRRLSVSYFNARQLKRNHRSRIKGRFAEGEEKKFQTAGATGRGGLIYEISPLEGRKFIPGGFLLPKSSLRHNPPDSEGYIAFWRPPDAKRKKISRGVWTNQLPIIKQKGPSAWGTFLKAGLETHAANLADKDLEHHVTRRLNLWLLRRQGRVKS